MPSPAQIIEVQFSPLTRKKTALSLMWLCCYNIYIYIFFPFPIFAGTAVEDWIPHLPRASCWPELTERNCGRGKQPRYDRGVGCELKGDLLQALFYCEKEEGVRAQWCDWEGSRTDTVWLYPATAVGSHCPALERQYSPQPLVSWTNPMWIKLRDSS